MKKNININLFFLALKEVSSSYWLIFLFAILSLLNYECEIVELKFGSQALIGINKVFVEILYAYVAGAIIFFFVETIPKAKRKASIYLFINNSTYWIYQYTSRIIKTISYPNIEPGKKFKINRDNFMGFAKEIYVSRDYAIESGMAPVLYKDYIIEYCNKIMISIDRMVPFLGDFDYSWIHTTSKIQDLVYKISEFLAWGEAQAKLEIAAQSLWPLNFHAKELFELCNSFHGKFRKIHHLQYDKDQTNISRFIFDGERPKR